MAQQITLVDGGSYIEIQYDSPLHIVTIPKKDIKTKIKTGIFHIYWDGDWKNHSQSPWIELNYKNVVSPTVASAAALRTLILGWITTDPEHFLDLSDIAIETYFMELSVDSYRNQALQIHSIDATGFTWKVYATLANSTDAPVPATGGTAGVLWIEVTDDLFGAAVTGTTIDKLAFVDTSTMPGRYLIEYTNQNVTNTVDAWFRKYNN